MSRDPDFSYKIVLLQTQSGDQSSRGEGVSFGVFPKHNLVRWKCVCYSRLYQSHSVLILFFVLRPKYLNMGQKLISFLFLLEF